VRLRRPRLPVEDRPPLGPDERILSWAESDVGLLVATNLGLWLPPGRLGWHEIHKATWDGQVLTVTAARVAEERTAYAVVEDLPPVPFTIPAPGDLHRVVRTRVTNSVGPSTHHELPGSGGVRVVARRVPGRDGWRWTARYDDGVDPDDPVVAEVTNQLVEAARQQMSG
jgi:hypothetical protein